MKIVGVIASRYSSTRLPGKALKDICGYPMVWWVYQKALKSSVLSELFVATDDARIVDVCNNFNIPTIMTSTTHPTAANRLYEVSLSINADYYIQINGDEPMLSKTYIDAVVPKSIPQDYEFGSSLVCKMTDPAEVMDPSNIKVIFDGNMNTLYMSRAPIPFPYKSLDFTYYKHIGIIGYNKKMLTLYGNTQPGIYEQIEGVDTLRFMDYGKQFLSIEVDKGLSLSIDTEKDLNRVRKIMENLYGKKFDINKIGEI